MFSVNAAWSTSLPSPRSISKPSLSIIKWKLSPMSAFFVLLASCALSYSSYSARWSIIGCWWILTLVLLLLVMLQRRSFVSSRCLSFIVVVQHLCYLGSYPLKTLFISLMFLLYVPTFSFQPHHFTSFLQEPSHYLEWYSFPYCNFFLLLHGYGYKGSKYYGPIHSLQPK